ncbi:hypothetical protein [Parapedobacter sp.]
MTVAKRLLFAALGFILLAAATCWGYWSYRQYRAGQTPIPRNATSVVRVHVDGLIRDIAWNALWNGAADRDTMAQAPAEFSLKAWKQLGIRIPANIFLYQVEHALASQFPSVHFGSLVVDDSTAFTKWLREKLGMEISSSKHGTIARSARALVVVQSTRALFALSPTVPRADLTALTEILANVLQQQGGQVAVSKSDFSEIIYDSGQVSGSGTHRFSIDFRKGSIAFNGSFETDYLPDRQEKTPHFADSNAVSLWIQERPAAFISGRQWDFGGYTLHGDRLLGYSKGPIIMEWKGTVTQQDTIVEFEYDDNFELVEIQRVVNKSVPEIYCSVLARTGLTDYLQAQGVLDTSTHTINRNALPLFRLGVSTLPSGYVQFHTARGPHPLPTPSNRSNELLYLRVNFDRLTQPGLPAGLAPYLQTMDLLELSGKPVTANKVGVHGTLYMKDGRRHSLIQLLTIHKNRWLQ